ncbi:unnamed protein product [Rhizopus stolonifer]
MNTNSVQVALRIRSLTEKDKAQPQFSHPTDTDILKAHDNSVVIVPHQKSFQFDHVLDASCTQEQVFNQVASSLVDRFIDGYNVTILAYGQTSSGKTYTMGTAIDSQSNPEQEGIVPRAMSTLFQKLCDIQKEKQPKTIISKRSFTALPSAFPPTSGIRAPSRPFSANVKLRPVSELPPRRGSNASPTNDKSTRYTVLVSFIEIYNEEFIDLLNFAPPSERTPVTIREDSKNNIIWTGLKEVQVSSVEDVLKYLQMGTENRATGSTDMNSQSSRSHAIFSVSLKQEKWVPSETVKKEAPKVQRGLTHRQSTLNVKELVGQMEKQRKQEEIEEQGEWMTVNSKFHFVDLAGSESLKQTAAEEEGIHINAGLSALGNVISSLSDLTNTHIPYRDSKLTQLLQDSLGGSSTTLMIACVSPAESNLNETVNTVKYAHRARHIKNKAERNEEWMTNDNVDHLRQIIVKLKSEIKALKQRRSPLSSLGSTPSLAPHETRSTSTVDTEPLFAASTLTIPDGCFDDAQLLVDLRRQIEELQNELTVTRERNLLVESELKQAEPVIHEYESSIAKLESQLVITRAALSHSDRALADQQTKIAEYESLQANEIRALAELKRRLVLAVEREQSSESYCNELKCKLEESISTGQRDQQVLTDLQQKISVFKEIDKDTEEYIHDLESRLSESETKKKTDPKVTELMVSIKEKQDKIELLESRLQEIEQLKTVLSELRKAHAIQVTRMEDALSCLKKQCSDYETQVQQEQESSQILKKTIQELSQSSELNSLEMQRSKEECQELEKILREQERSSQITLRQRLEDLERFKLDLRALEQVEEKQDSIIQGLEAKLREMDQLVNSLREQLEKCNVSMDRLQADNEAKTKMAADMKIQVSKVLNDVYGMGTEKKQLERVMYFIESTLRLQDAKSDRAMEALEDIKKHYMVREEDLEEKKRTLKQLSDEKNQLSLALEQALERASQSDEMLKNLQGELEATKGKRDEQLKKTQSMVYDNDDLNYLKTFENHVHELEQQIKEFQKTDIDRKAEMDQLNSTMQIQLTQNKALVQTISELESSLKTERALASSQDTTGMISQLGDQLSKLQESKKKEDDTWKEQMERLKEELDLTRKENQLKDQHIETLESSLKEAKQQLSQNPKEYSENLNAYFKSNYSTESIPVDATHEDLVERITQLQEDNHQIVSWNESLESQLVLQRSQFTLETKNLELELMKLTAANERLEKEMEKIVPRNSVLVNSLAPHSEEPTQFISPPLTPRVSSPPPTTSTPYKMQRDHSNSSLIQLSRSGTYLSMSNILNETEEEAKRISVISSRSDVGSPRPSSSLRGNRPAVSSGSIPPLTAPPSNPLPPVPTPLPMTPSPAFGEPSSPTRSDTLSASLTSLYRHNSARFSEMSVSHFTPEQYDKILQSLQRKTHHAENDIKAHQDVISKLESQLTRSESSIKEAKKQLDTLHREKEAYNEEIQNLRTQVNQTQDSLAERKQLEQELESQKELREKAEKARRILEDRMEELMSKKSKFMCF